MKRLRRSLYRLRGGLLDLAHTPRLIDTPWHDRLERLAYRVIDPLIWL